MDDYNMMDKTTIFSVPIYLYSRSDFFDKIKQKQKEKEKKYKETYAFKKLNIPYEPYYKKTVWKYDKIIGWIEFYLIGKTIKADCWFINSRRITINLKAKQFEYYGKIGDVSHTHIISNNEIITEIKDFLSKCQEGKFFKLLKKYYIDTTEIDNLLEFLDIKGMIESLTKKESNN